MAAHLEQAEVAYEREAAVAAPKMPEATASERVMMKLAAEAEATASRPSSAHPPDPVTVVSPLLLSPVAKEEPQELPPLESHKWP